MAEEDSRTIPCHYCQTPYPRHKLTRTLIGELSCEECGYS